MPLLHTSRGDFETIVDGPEDGPLVLLLHGFPELNISWRHQIPVLAAAGYRVVAPNQRGYKGSVRHGSYATADLAADVVAMIDALGADKAIIVGHDWGGGVAWTLTHLHPERVERLVAMNCPPPAVMVHEFATNPAQLAKSWYMFFFQIPRLPEWILTRNHMAALERGFRDMVVRKDREVFTDEDLREIKRSFDPPGAATAAVNYYRAQFRNRAALTRYSLETRIKCPTLLIWAEDDVALGKELTVGTDALVDAPFSIRFIPDCSHWVQQERPEEVNEALLAFLRS